MVNTIDLFAVCTAREGEGASTRDLIQCISDEGSAMLQSANASSSPTRSMALVFASALVFFMQAGFAMVCAGAVRRKNVQNTMLKNLLDACGASLAFFAVGYAFAFGGDDPNSGEKTFIGTKNFLLMDVKDLGFWLFEYAFSAASATIVAGSLAERCQMAAYLCYSMMLSGWVYPVVAHAVWSPQGFLSANTRVDPLWGTGVIDYAGSGVVHVTGGLTALMAAKILGPRRGRFYDDMGEPLDTPIEIPRYSVALQMLGTFILWFGWYGFNSGNAFVRQWNEQSGAQAELSAANTTLAAGVAGIVSLLVNYHWLDRTTGEAIFDLEYVMNGSLTGLVAIAAGCTVVEPWAAVIIGFVAGLVYFAGARLLIHIRIDDAVNAIPVHMCGGIWGVLSVGLFASPRYLETVYHRTDHPGLFYSWHQGNSNATLLGTQVVGLLFIAGWVITIMLPFFVWLDWKGWFRSDMLDELVGLDTSFHGAIHLISSNKDDEVPSEYIRAFNEKKKAAKAANMRGLRKSYNRNHPPLTTVDEQPSINEQKSGGLEESSEFIIR